MARQLHRLITGEDVPDSSRAILTRAEYVPAIGKKGRGPDEAGVSAEGELLPSSRKTASAAPALWPR
jgi:hypothetical protein